MPSYIAAGFNDFLDRSIESDPQATTLNTLPSVDGRSFNLDQLQVSGALGNTMQLGGSISGGTVRDGTLRDLSLQGDLTLGGKLIVGNNKFVIDGSTVRLTIIDDAGVERVVLGKVVGGF